MKKIKLNNNFTKVDEKLENLSDLLNSSTSDFCELLTEGVFHLKEKLKGFNKEDIEFAILKNPTSLGVRRICYFYEVLFGKELSVPANFLEKVRYSKLIDSEKYVTRSEGDLNRKFKIEDNGISKLSNGFYPIVRKTEKVKELLSTDLNLLVKGAYGEYSSSIIGRAIRYSYLKETKNTFLIEGEEFKQNKNAGFLKLISEIPLSEKLSIEDITNFHKTIYEKGSEIRNYQNGIGVEYNIGESIIEYVSPKPEDVYLMLEDLISFYNSSKKSLNPLILSTLLSFHFVSIHPFADGNGRMSRFLLQYGLMNGGVGKENKFLVPISAYIEKNKESYYNIFKERSEKILKETNHWIENRRIFANGNNRELYNTIDLTLAVEFFFDAFKTSIKEDFKKDVEYIEKYHKVYDFFDQSFNIESSNLGLITNLIIQGNGVFSKNKKEMLIKKYGFTIKELDEFETSLTGQKILS